MTERLFDGESYIREFQSEVVKVIPEKEYFKAVLNRTAFFPEGGGQGADSGTLNQIEVFDVREQDGIVYHYIKEPVPEGQPVTGRINWYDRFTKMQQHTGEHIVSGIVHNIYGYDNVGFHLGDDVCTMDFSGPLNKEQLKEVERMANEAIYENLKIEVLYPVKSGLDGLDYRSKIEIEGQVRLVHIPGYDLCACCAPHVKFTGEIGVIKLVAIQNYKGGVRVTMLCGRRALADYGRKDTSVKMISAALSAKETAVWEAVSRLKGEAEHLKEQLHACEKRLLEYKAEKITADRDSICLFEAELDGDEPRELVNLIVAKGIRICAVFFSEGENGYRYVLGSAADDVRPLGKQMNEAFAGRGGGKPEMVQGMVKATEEQIKEFFENI